MENCSKSNGFLSTLYEYNVFTVNMLNIICITVDIHINLQHNTIISTYVHTYICIKCMYIIMYFEHAHTVCTVCVFVTECSSICLCIAESFPRQNINGVGTCVELDRSLLNHLSALKSLFVS